MAPLLVAAIDFGTTYSGWSYSFKHEFDLEPTKVVTKRWYGDSLMSMKAPTCVLIEPDGETFTSFGYDAENKYTSLVEAEEHDKWYFFRRFKMKLYNKNIHRDMELEDETGKKLKANFVFSVAIRFLKDDLLKVIEERMKGGVQPEEISWVLTVPAIWDGGAKQFMRESAETAGISSDKLSIALEPEAAAIYCRLLPMENNDQDGLLSTLKTGSKVLVVDAGGGTVDIAVQEVAENGSMKNIFKASGGDWGGTKVDEAYVRFLEDMLGKDTIDEFKRSNMEDYMFMSRQFEMKKREVDPLHSDKPVVFRISATLPELVKQRKGMEIHDLIIHSAYNNTVSIKADKLKVDMDIVRNFFKIQVDAIVDHVSNLLDPSNIGDIGAILLVGGFNDCPLLQQAMKTTFVNHTIIIPNEPDLAVLKGAVIFGHKPELISQRVSQYTYGVKARVPFIAHVHKDSYKKIIEDGKVCCCNVFDKHIAAGQCLIIGEAQVEKNYSPFDSSGTALGFNVYYTLEPDPMYITDEGCSLAGTLKVPIEGSGLARSVTVRLIYGGTEIEVKAIEIATGKVHRMKIDFLG
ncbi:heat shock 70 kDa protein 12A-like isoform X1 [Mya arenaria]|uniref:heat shock 70 kDa protein 12A-like isoform X1 n=1 Tax=Mya arenaria TaxID=6604 RepID=UPI0022E5E98C|nr:heat shock 70 kDa protein 12A-like isoform X1 [Mya arenaria]